MECIKAGPALPGLSFPFPMSPVVSGGLDYLLVYARNSLGGEQTTPASIILYDDTGAAPANGVTGC
eukprot:6278817-Amphidinium_carterae.1